MREMREGTLRTIKKAIREHTSSVEMIAASTTHSRTAFPVSIRSPDLKILPYAVTTVGASMCVYNPGMQAKTP